MAELRNGGAYNSGIGETRDITPERRRVYIQVDQELMNLGKVELSNQELLNQLFSHINLQVKELSNSLTAKLTLTAYASNEEVIQGAIDNIQILTSTNGLPTYHKDVWGSKADKLKESISYYLSGINGTNLNGGDILDALANQKQVLFIFSDITKNGSYSYNYEFVVRSFTPRSFMKQCNVISRSLMEVSQRTPSTLNLGNYYMGM